MHTCRFDMTAFCWWLRSDSSDTSNETVPLPSSMLVRRRIPAVSQLLNHDHLALDAMHAMIGCAAAIISILLDSESKHKDEKWLIEACLSSQHKFQLQFDKSRAQKRCTSWLTTAQSHKLKQQRYALHPTKFKWLIGIAAACTGDKMMVNRYDVPPTASSTCTCKQLLLEPHMPCYLWVSNTTARCCCTV